MHAQNKKTMNGCLYQTGQNGHTCHAGPRRAGKLSPGRAERSAHAVLPISQCTSTVGCPCWWCCRFWARVRRASALCFLFATLCLCCSTHAAVLASWYDCTGFTCATWDYPLGTRLRVIEIHNRRSVIVIVNDRGPARRLHRKIDLSRAAFLQLDGLELGIAEVTIQPIK